MAVEKVFFRDSEIEINTGTIAVPVWTVIANKKSLAATFSSNETDLTDWESDGDTEHAVMSRVRSFTLACHRMEDVATGNRDPGQEAAETLGDQVGNASIGQFRLTTPGASTWIFHASASVNPFAGSGGNDDAIEWSAELKVSGAITKA